MTGRFIALTASVLRTGPDRIDPHAGLNALGLDSLLAMELRARINSELGVAPPVVALLSGTPVAELITQLHDALAELVAHEAGGADAAAVEVFEDELRHPLTQNQKALWFLRQLNPEGYAYNIGGAVEVRVALDPDLMFEAVRCLVARHPRCGPTSSRWTASRCSRCRRRPSPTSRCSTCGTRSGRTSTARSWPSTASPTTWNTTRCSASASSSAPTTAG